MNCFSTFYGVVLSKVVNEKVVKDLCVVEVKHLPEKIPAKVMCDIYYARSPLIMSNKEKNSPIMTDEGLIIPVPTVDKDYKSVIENAIREMYPEGCNVLISEIGKLTMKPSV